MKCYYTRPEDPRLPTYTRIPVDGIPRSWARRVITLEERQLRREHGRYTSVHSIALTSNHSTISADPNVYDYRELVKHYDFLAVLIDPPRNSSRIDFDRLVSFCSIYESSLPLF